MNFKVGDKVMVTAPGWQGWQEECTVIKMGYSSKVIFVRKANGAIPAIYKSWASIIRPKNQQLLFSFME